MVARSLSLSAALLLSLVSSQHEIYTPNPDCPGGCQIREPGVFGQDCTPGSGDYPDKCPILGQTLSDPLGEIGCQHNFDCCMCGKIECLDCVGLICNGDSSCFGVKNIEMVGEPEMGASINCNGDLSCQGTKINGTNIGEIYCTGDNSCAFSEFRIECLVVHGEGCAVQCVGDGSCEGDPLDSPRKDMLMLVENSFGLSCAHDACRYGVFRMTSNVGSNIDCKGQEGCLGADILVNNVEGVICGLADSCKNARMVIVDPQQDFFALVCSGPKACVGLEIEIIITDPLITHIDSISCVSAQACKGAIMTVFKAGATATNGLTIASVVCGQFESCMDMRVDLGPFVTVEECHCAGGATNSCVGFIGVPGCVTGP